MLEGYEDEELHWPAEFQIRGLLPGRAGGGDGTFVTLGKPCSLGSSALPPTEIPGIRAIRAECSPRLLLRPSRLAPPERFLHGAASHGASPGRCTKAGWAHCNRGLRRPARGAQLPPWVGEASPQLGGLPSEIPASPQLGGGAWEQLGPHPTRDLREQKACSMGDVQKTYPPDHFYTHGSVALGTSTLLCKHRHHPPTERFHPARRKLCPHSTGAPTLLPHPGTVLLSALGR